MQTSDGEPGPIGSEVLAPGWAAFADGQMPWGDVAFDTDLAAKVLWDLAVTPALDPGDVDVRKSCGAHRVMIAVHNLSTTRARAMPAAGPYRTLRPGWSSRAPGGGGG